MRKAAGILLIILGAIVLGINVFVLWFYASSRIDLLGVFMFAWTIFALIGGILCLMRRHWGVCLASAIAAVVFGLVEFPLVFIGGIVSTAFISLRKKEWKEFSDSVDGKASNGG